MAHIQIRISDEEKQSVQEAFKKMGMTMSSGIKIFLRRVAAEKKMPFEIVETAFPRKKEKPVLGQKEVVDVSVIEEIVLPAEPVEAVVEEIVLPAEPIKEAFEETVLFSDQIENVESALPSELIEEEIETTSSSEKMNEKKSSNFNRWNLFEKHEIG